MSIGTDPRPLSPGEALRLRKAGAEGAPHVIDDYHIEIAPGQKLYAMEWGNPNGVPAIVLHGGPGTGFAASHVALFDPEVHHVIFFDQRGCGESTPAASKLDEQGVTECANTDNIEADVALLRQKFFQDRPVILQGTSWGSTMPLIYAERHGKKEVEELVIGSIFFGTKEETSGMFEQQHDPNFPYKQEHGQFLDYLAHGDGELRARLEAMSGREMVLYIDEMMKPQTEVARLHADAAEAYEYMLCQRDGQEADGNAYRTLLEEEQADPNALSHARIEFRSHVNGAFLKGENEILDNVGNLEGIRTTILQGERDLCTLEKYAWQLHEAIQNAGGISSIKIVEGAGHLRSDKNMKEALQQALLAAADRYKEKYGG